MGSCNGVVGNVQPECERVGARHTESPTPPGQGGYLDNCNNPKSALEEKKFSKNDSLNNGPYHARPDLQQTDLFWIETGPRILTEHFVPAYRDKPAASRPVQFTDINLPPMWQRIAANIGSTAFLELLGLMWDFAPRDGERQRVDVPSRDTFARLYRNGVIRQCAAMGLDSGQTVRTLNQKKIPVSETTVNRVLKYIPWE